jgi:hypothetical protein
VESYSGLFEGLSSSSKIERIENLSRSLKTEKKTKDNNFYKAFGAFASEKSAETIIKGIRASRKFRKKEIHLSEGKAWKTSLYLKLRLQSFVNGWMVSKSRIDLSETTPNAGNAASP